MRFLGLGLHELFPDAKTIWLFREQLTRAGAIRELFASFDARLKARGHLAMSGQIVDASIIAAPRQRNTEAEKTAIKEGRIPRIGLHSRTSWPIGVYCRRWGIPLIDGGTVRLPRLVGQGRALEIILTGRKVAAEEALRIGMCERVVETGSARTAAEAMAHEIARFPQAAVRADRQSAYEALGLTTQEALRHEWGTDSRRIS